MKVAINCQIGGFELSHKAMVRYAELSGFKLYPAIEEPICSDKYRDYDPAQDKDKPMRGIYYFKKPLSENPDLSKDSCLLDYRMERTDPILIQVVEELKNSSVDELPDVKIVEIPDDIEWELHESEEGYEWIAEKHRTWS